MATRTAKRHEKEDLKFKVQYAGTVVVRFLKQAILLITFLCLLPLIFGAVIFLILGNTDSAFVDACILFVFLALNVCIEL